MAVADSAGLPVAIYAESAAPHEVRLVEQTLCARFTDQRPEKLIGDKAYDSDPLDERLARFEIELIAPHKTDRKKAEDAGRQKNAALQTALEDRAIVCLAAKFPTGSGSIRLS